MTNIVIHQIWLYRNKNTFDNKGPKPYSKALRIIVAKALNRHIRSRIYNRLVVNDGEVMVEEGRWSELWCKIRNLECNSVEIVNLVVEKGNKSLKQWLYNKYDLRGVRKTKITQELKMREKDRNKRERREKSKRRKEAYKHRRQGNKTKKDSKQKQKQARKKKGLKRKGKSGERITKYKKIKKEARQNKKQGTKLVPMQDKYKRKWVEEYVYKKVRRRLSQWARNIRISTEFPSIAKQLRRMRKEKVDIKRKNKKNFIELMAMNDETWYETLIEAGRKTPKIRDSARTGFS